MSSTEVDLTDFSRSLLESKVWPLLVKVIGFLDEQDIESYLVGGMVRDLLLGRDTADIDIAISANALAMAPQAATALGGKYVLLDKVNRIGRVILASEDAPPNQKQWEIDFSTFQGDIKQDLWQRDFTIDAMAISLSELGRSLAEIQLIDPVDGWYDLHQRVIRAVAKTTFTSDAARLLRAVRLAAELDLSIEPKTEALIRHDSALIASVAGERIREELLRLLAVPHSGQLLPYLDDLGLLMAIFPELSETKGVEQPKEHFWDVFEHSLKTVQAIEFLLREGTWEYASKEVLATVPWSAALMYHFDQEVSSGSTRKSLLKLAALLHDIAKPQTKTTEASGRIRFLGHAQAGAISVTTTLERLRFSVKESKLVETLVRYHLRPGQLSQDDLPTHRAIYRYFHDAAEAGIDILFLSLADHLATRGPQLDLAYWQKHTQNVAYVLSQYFEQKSTVHPPKLIDGHDLLNIFSLNPGPKIGGILETIREARASGEITNRQEALSLVEKLLKQDLLNKKE